VTGKQVPPCIPTGQSGVAYIEYQSVGQVTVDECTMWTRGGVTVQGQMTDNGAKVHKQLRPLTSTLPLPLPSFLLFLLLPFPLSFPLPFSPFLLSPPLRSSPLKSS